MANVASMKLNRQQKLLTAEQLRRLPALYSQDGKGYGATAHVKFFLGAYTWYATEFDPQQGLFFGLVFNQSMADQMPHGELGYFSAAELCEHKLPVRLFGDVRGTFYQQVERDIHFRPQTLRDALKREHGVDVDQPAEELPAGEAAAMAEFDALYADEPAPAAEQAEEPKPSSRSRATGGPRRAIR